jgi:hypothetical protein
MIFKKQKPYCEVGTITNRLGMRTIYIGERRWEWLRAKERLIFSPSSGLNQHICIIGTSGSGKSNACRTIAKAIARQGIRFAILDPHGEYASFAQSMGASIYDASRSGINIFELDGMSEREKANELVSMFKRTFRIGEVQGYTLHKCLMYTYRICRIKEQKPNLKGLLFTIKVFYNKADPKEKRILESLEKRLSLLDTDRFPNSCSIEQILSENSVMVLQNLHTPEAQSIYIEGFLRKIYTNMLSMKKENKPRFYAIIDEAAKVKGSDILAKIAAEGRKYGFGIIALSQRAKEMDKGLRANSAMFISFYQREPEELNYIANYVAGGVEGSRFAEVKKALRSLQRGNAIILDSYRKEPVIVRFDESGNGRGSAIDAIIAEQRPVFSKKEIKERMKRAGHDERESEQAIADAMRNRLLFGYELRNCGSYSGIWYVKSIRNSAEHDVSVNVIARKLQESGISCTVYNSSNGPDIAVANNQTAIEYETGSKAIEVTAEMIERRKALYKNILVVTTQRYVPTYSGIAKTVEINKLLQTDKEELRSITII